jgi:hypothetical protein
MIAWKILNARTVQELAFGTQKPWYCALGDPMVRGGGLRGTILGVFREDFVMKRLGDLDYWSPADLGGVAAGLSPIARSAAPLLRVPSKAFEELILATLECPELARAIRSHEPLDATALSPFMTHAAVMALTTAPYDEYSWMFELAFGRLQPLRVGELLQLYVPSAAIPWIRTVLPILTSKDVQVYNSALGLESSIPYG